MGKEDKLRIQLFRARIKNCSVALHSCCILCGIKCIKINTWELQEFMKQIINVILQLVFDQSLNTVLGQT